MRTKHTHARADTRGRKARRHSDPAQPAQHHDVHGTRNSVPGTGSHPPCHGAAATPPPPSKSPLSPSSSAMLRGFSCAATGRRFPPLPVFVLSPSHAPVGSGWVGLGLSAQCGIRPQLCLFACRLVCLVRCSWSRLLPQKSGLGFVTFCAVPSTGERNCMCLARDAAATLAMLAMLKIRTFLSRTDQARERVADNVDRTAAEHPVCWLPWTAREASEGPWQTGSRHRKAGDGSRDTRPTDAIWLSLDIDRLGHTKVQETRSKRPRQTGGDGYDMARNRFLECAGGP